MAVVGVDSVQSGANQQAISQSNNVMGKDQFMKLLVAQLQHQDPLNPMDSTGFTAQLAQFSSLEQLQNVNTNLGNISASQASLGNAQAVSFIGKEITSSGSAFEVKNGVSDRINFNLEEDAAIVKIGVYNDRGEVVRVIEAGRMDAGEQSIVWDGLNQEGERASDGAYSYEILAVDMESLPVEVTTYSSGRVTGVNFKDGVPYLLTNQIEIPLSSVIRVAEPVDVDE